MGVLFSAHILIFVPHPDKTWDLYGPFSCKVSSDFVDSVKLPITTVTLADLHHFASAQDLTHWLTWNTQHDVGTILPTYKEKRHSELNVKGSLDLFYLNKEMEKREKLPSYFAVHEHLTRDAPCSTKILTEL